MSNPKYMKDASGFCYAYTDAIANQSHLTPWDGAVHPNGFADPEADPPKPVAKATLTKPVKAKAGA